MWEKTTNCIRLSKTLESVSSYSPSFLPRRKRVPPMVYSKVEETDCGSDQSIPFFREDLWNRKAKTDLSKQIYSKGFDGQFWWPSRGLVVERRSSRQSGSKEGCLCYVGVEQNDEERRTNMVRGHHEDKKLYKLAKVRGRKVRDVDQVKCIKDEDD
ncbi:hypothetical protein H5410_030300 [Solanum commersonii]|uniref:Uncharacterized protein n=1 Tax=Solanum commersonii TaxID=4109 RepID=A0A9J5YFB4_SOLCO|nr:hypothetical protein H5410_030300 [Solanum commersonii]